jgi:hypothetical protein
MLHDCTSQLGPKASVPQQDAQAELPHAATSDRRRFGLRIGHGPSTTRMLRLSGVATQAISHQLTADEAKNRNVSSSV